MITPFPFLILIFGLSLVNGLMSDIRPVPRWPMATPLMALSLVNGLPGRRRQAERFGRYCGKLGCQLLEPLA